MEGIAQLIRVLLHGWTARCREAEEIVPFWKTFDDDCPVVGTVTNNGTRPASDIDVEYRCPSRRIKGGIRLLLVANRPALPGAKHIEGRVVFWKGMGVG